LEKARFKKKKIVIFWSEKKAHFFEKSSKNRKKAPQSPRPRDKEPDSVFFCHSVFFLCGEAREDVCGGHQAFLRCAKGG
jgi:hypothetical protein